MVFGTLAMLTIGIAPPVSAENWEFREDLGGWYDVESGLVWGQPSQDWSQYGYNWLAASQVAIPQYRQMTGNSKWRLPTAEEFQTAYQHNAWAYFSQTSDYHGGWWSSTAGTGKNKKDAWMMSNIITGLIRLSSQQSGLRIIPVYRP
jgi:hypothetical protein